ncbi:class I SAM-dependent methyltransferase (plasmid) [Agrobacterium sp. rho-13.3]|uniref:class I SAM-dependent methyltransferase n=1 Tax=Agrobacterium sp. rho-13.3 TaxID=3072980 RepID=UPI002A12EBBF|nr:methyltransferase domain-containing protein [Agrobacterium sp. rho-13.3]MDX8310300.1 methyltransferase domain-containing protein [Agrobacterium sp. rho-13.3]
MAKFDGQHERYIEGAMRNVHGLDGLHRMTGQLLAERVPADGRVLVVGAGGGIELKALAEQHRGWSFDGIDPLTDMLMLAKETTACAAGRIRFHQCDISSAPDGPFNGAVCLLVFHHLSFEERAAALHGISRRLHPGSPFVLAHISIPQREPDRSLWTDRHVGFGAKAEIDRDKLDAARIAMKERLFISSPEQEEANLRQAGFTGIVQFYQAFSFRGWVAYA